MKLSGMKGALIKIRSVGTDTEHLEFLFEKYQRPHEFFGLLVRQTGIKLSPTGQHAIMNDLENMRLHIVSRARGRISSHNFKLVDRHKYNTFVNACEADGSDSLWAESNIEMIPIGGL